jgi:signal transduction histidine kinase
MAGFKTQLQFGALARKILWVAGILTPLCSAALAQESQVILTNAAQILSLPPERADVKTPVRIRGMVTYHEPGVVLFVQDETAGIFVYHLGERLGFRAGQYLEVSGGAAPGLYSHIIAWPQFQLLEAGPRIIPRAVSLADIDLGYLDAQWVEFTGIVEGLRTLPGWLELEVVVPPHRITVRVAEYEGYDRLRLAGSYIRVRGVVATSFLNKGPLVGFKVLANTLSDVTIIQQGAENPFSEPLLSIRDLRGEQVRRLMPRQVRTKGIVTLCWPDRTLFIQDFDASLEVQARESVDDLRPGDAIEVAGFPGPVLGPPVLEGALIRKLGTEPVPRAVRISTDDLFLSNHNRELVEIEADLLGRDRSSSNLWTLVLQGQNHYLNALLSLSGATREILAIRPGSRLRLTGVCVREDALAGTDPKVRLLLRSSSDILAVSAPPTLPRHGMAVASAIAVVTTVGLLLALWHIGKQRDRTHHMLQLQTSLEAEMRQNEQQLRRSMEERERMGRDLHDDIIQSIYAVGLNLEDCRRVLSKSPEQAEARLSSAIESLNTSIRHVRGFLAGLEPKVFNGREFKTALKSLALTSGDDPAQFQLDVDPSAANRLTPAQATQLLHIAKEAISNSLRHARASALVVSLLPTSTGLRLEVFDNGEGFNPEALGSTGHGLRNMTARAREIGAELQISSAVGQGCRILVNVPQRNGNEHG